jgi:hypothetical protein
LIHAGFCHGSLRKIHAAEKTWKHASATAAVAKPAFRWMGSLKKSRKYPFDRGSCADRMPAVREKTANAVIGAASHA